MDEAELDELDVVPGRLSPRRGVWVRRRRAEVVTPGSSNDDRLLESMVGSEVFIQVSRGHKPSETKPTVATQRDGGKASG